MLSASRARGSVSTDLPLFAPEGGFDRGRLASRLKTLAQENVWIGTSSWKYEGWIGQIYSRDRYLTHGRFSTKRFEQTCLAEYAEVFPAVCGDFSFYQFPAPDYWSRLFQSGPPGLRWALKAPEEITVKRFPTHPRYGARGGTENEVFLDAKVFERLFLDSIGPYLDRVLVVIFEFGTFSKQSYPGVAEFAADLHRFLSALPKTTRHAVEIRNPEYLTKEYFDCLRDCGIAHTFNAWTRMPEIGVQMRIPGAYPSDFTVVRALLRRGRAYENAVAQFSPYSQIQEPNAPVREALRGLISRARERHEPSYLFVNNRLEGNAPGTIECIVEE